MTLTLLRASGLGGACRCTFGVDACGGRATGCVGAGRFGVSTRGLEFGAVAALSWRCAFPWLRAIPFASGLFTFARGTAAAFPFGASALPFGLAVGAGTVACAVLPRFMGFPRVAVPRDATGLATAGGVFGNCGRTTATVLPLFSRRSGFTRASVGNAWSLIFMVGIFVRDALAIVFGSIPWFTIELLRPVNLLTATAPLCTTRNRFDGRQWRRTFHSQKWLVGTYDQQFQPSPKSNPRLMPWPYQVSPIPLR